jgi:hypothetical protein
VSKAFSVEAFDHEETFLNKGLITIIIIYLFYMRDQLFKVFFHVETVCFYRAKIFPKCPVLFFVEDRPDTRSWRRRCFGQ